MNLIDYILLGVLLLFLIIGIKNGFAKVILRFVATVVAAVGARIGAEYAAPYLYDTFLHEKINGKIASILPSGSVGGSLDALIGAIKDALPEPAYKIADFLHLLPSQGKFDQVLTVDQLEATYVQPIITKVLLIITIIAIFLILSVILMLVVNAVNKHFFEDKHGVLSTINRVFGGIFGLIRGAVPVTVGCLLLNLIAPLVSEGKFTELVERSMFCSFVASIF